MPPLLSGGGPLLVRRRARLRSFLRKIIEEELERQLWGEQSWETLDGKVEELLERRASPYQVAGEILKEIGR